MKVGHGTFWKRAGAMVMSLAVAAVSIPLGGVETVQAEQTIHTDTIANESLRVQIGDLGQIASLNIVNNRNNMNFVLPCEDDTSTQNTANHQWMGEMIFSYRTGDSAEFPDDREGFVEVDTNKTLAAGGTTTANDAEATIKSNPYITKTVDKDNKYIKIDYKGLTAEEYALKQEQHKGRAIQGFNVSSEYDLATDDGSLLWSITLENTSDKYIEFGDVGLPMPWNANYGDMEDIYQNRVTIHTFAGADSGYAYAVRCSGEGNYILFTPVVDSGARIEYIDNWIGTPNGVVDNRADSMFAGWTSDSGLFLPGLNVYYVHSKDIQKTGRGYFKDATSLILEPGGAKTYQFKFSAVRAGDNSPQNSASDPNNASDSAEEREKNFRSILYKAGMIDAIAVPGFQTAINMDTLLDLHYDESLIKDVSVDIQCVHENDPFDEEHIPVQKSDANGSLVNNSRGGRGTHDGNPGYSESCTLKETKKVDGETHHIYNMKFGCIGNNSVRVDYKRKVDGEWVDKFTEYEFNVLAEIEDTVNTRADFLVNTAQDTDPASETFGIYSDWYFLSGRDAGERDHWGDDWSHDNINFITMKNYLNPDAAQVKSIENYLIDFMWENYMKYNHENYVIANYLRDSGIYGTSSNPYSRTFSEYMEATGFFNMYRIEKAYPELMTYREPPRYYLEKAYQIYITRVGSGPVGFYGEQQVPDMIEALRTEGMEEEAQKLQERFALEKGSNVAIADYPYGSEFSYDNTGEEGAYAAAKSLLKYYPDSDLSARAKNTLKLTDMKTRAMRGIQPTWYQYADPVFKGGESWWNFQYTASLAGYIMDDYLRYEEHGYDSGWAARLNYAAKISNLNAVNMGQISDKYIGNVAWRYSMYKGGNGAQDVNDRGTRIMDNGWNDYSGESDEGLYGSLLTMSSDIVSDPVFGLVAYGSRVTDNGSSYSVVPMDGIGKRINLLDERIYVGLVQDKCTEAVISKDGTAFELKVESPVAAEHLSQINLSGAGIGTGCYSVSVNGIESGTFYMDDAHEGSAYAKMPGGASTITIAKKDGGENTAPNVTIRRWNEASDSLTISTEGNVREVKAGEGLQLTADITLAPVLSNPEAMIPFLLEGVAYDDGLPNGRLTYHWEAVSVPDGGELIFTTDNQPYAEVRGTVSGTYVVELTVSDGALETKRQITIEIGGAPERKAPEITKAEGKQDAVNTTTAKLAGEAVADPVYGGALLYQWSVESQPNGGNAVIASQDKPEAVLKVDTNGVYKIRLTVTDADKVSTKDIEVTMGDGADGVWRVDSVITPVGTAPEMPSSVTYINAEGAYETGNVTWNGNADYNVVGVQEVQGSIGTVPVAVSVYVVSGTLQNVALYAEPTAIIDTPQDLGGVSGLNDDYEPSSSADESQGVWHNWLGGAQGDPAWVMYTWDEPMLIVATEAYYFRNFADNFTPKEVTYEYLDADGTWKELPNATGFGVEVDQYNRTEFAPVITTKLRMTMTPESLGCGVIEWKVYGYSDRIPVNRKALRAALAKAKGLSMNLFEDGAEATLKRSVAKAQAVNDNKDASQEEIDVAANALERTILYLPRKEADNLACVAGSSTSFVSSWESLEAVNDGKLDGAHYGSWGNSSASEWVVYTWSEEVNLTGADMYFWSDGGGIQYPADYSYEYLDASGNWQEITPVNTDDSEKGSSTWLVKTTWNDIVTTSLRITMQKVEETGDGVGIWEWKVYGSLTGTPPTDEPDVSDAPEGTVNLALYAETDGVCNYDGMSAGYDQGGLPKMKDGFDPSSSADLEHGTWLNYRDRTEIVNGETQAKTPWVSYKWNKPVVLNRTDIYYFSEGEGGAHEMPASVEIQYLDESDDNDWKKIDVTPGCLRDQYNSTDLGGITATGLKLILTPQTWNPDELVHGVGIIEWKVFGSYAAEDASYAAAPAENSVLQLRTPETPANASDDSESSTAGKVYTLLNAADRAAQNADQSVVWSVSGNTQAGTAIDANGYLKVDKNEQAASITVKAALAGNPDCSAQLALTVIPSQSEDSGNNTDTDIPIVPNYPFPDTTPSTPTQPGDSNAIDNQVIKAEQLGSDGTFYDKDGNIIKNAIVEAPDGNWYITGADGKPLTDRLVDVSDGTIYFVKANGVIAKDQVVTVDKSNYYAQANGVIAKDGFYETVKKNTVYAYPDGHLASNEIFVVGKDKYYAKKNCAVVKNGFYKTESGNKVYAKKSGVLVTNKLFTVNGKKYYAKTSGVIAANQFCTTPGGNRFYVNKSGVCVTDKLFTVNGKKYYAKKSGALATNQFCTTPGGNRFYVNKSGVLVTNKLFTVNGKKYYAKKSGALATEQWVTVGNKKYYCSKSGKITKVKKIKK